MNESVNGLLKQTLLTATCGSLPGYSSELKKPLSCPSSQRETGNNAQFRLTMMVPKRRYLSYLRERWWVVLICVAALMSGMVALETVRTGKYISYAQIYMTGNVQINVGNLLSEESLTYYGTQIELLKSARLQGAAFEKAESPFRRDTRTCIRWKLSSL